MRFRKITFAGAFVGLTVSLLVHAAAPGEDKDQGKADAKTAAAKDGQPAGKTIVTKSMKMVQNLGTGFALIDYGRAENDPTSLLVAARILGTTPISEMKFERGEDNKESRHEAVAFDAAGLEKRAHELVGEARGMIKDLPQSERAAVEELAKATTILLKERDRGVVGGPGSARGFIYPNGSGDPVPFHNVSLNGTYTEFRVQSLDGVDLDLKVVGALTGKVYGHDSRSYSNASVRFNHFPICVVHVYIENHGNRRGDYILYHN